MRDTFICDNPFFPSPLHMSSQKLINGIDFVQDVSTRTRNVGLIWIFIIDTHLWLIGAVWCGSKNKHPKIVYIRDKTMHSKLVEYYRVNRQHNGVGVGVGEGGLYVLKTINHSRFNRVICKVQLMEPWFGPKPWVYENQYIVTQVVKCLNYWVVSGY